MLSNIFNVSYFLLPAMLKDINSMLIFLYEDKYDFHKKKNFVYETPLDLII